MSRHDWLFVGARLYGVYLLATLALRAPSQLWLFFQDDEYTRLATAAVYQHLPGSNFWSVLSFAIHIILGWLLAFRTKNVLSLLGSRD